jgi:hypothetical protein
MRAAGPISLATEPLIGSAPKSGRILQQKWSSVYYAAPLTNRVLKTLMNGSSEAQLGRVDRVIDQLQTLKTKPQNP